MSIPLQTPDNGLEVTTTNFGAIGRCGIIGDMGIQDLNGQLKEIGLVNEGNGAVPCRVDEISHAIATVGQDLYPTLNIDKQTALDMLELACEGYMGGGQAVACNLTKPPSVHNVQDFERLGYYLQCRGDEISLRAATAVFKLPSEAIENLTNGGTEHQAKGGAMTTAISELRSALLEVAKSGPVIGSTVRKYGQRLRALRAQLERLEIADDMSDIELASQVTQQITNCLTASLGGGSLDLVATGSSKAAAIATCGNSLAQIGFAIALDELKEESNRQAVEEALADFAEAAEDYTVTLEREAINLSQALETVKRQLDLLESLKGNAAPALDLSLWYLSTQAANQGEISNALRNIKEGSKIRYTRALDNARRMAFLAKRAIEQRLGLSLAEMVEDMPLVTAPAGWESTICTTTGIDYESLLEAGQAENFADGFVGDYVTKLENVVESYRLVNNFHEGTDTVVASLRDDIQAVRAECDVESRNHLLFASDLGSALWVNGASMSGWVIEGCQFDVLTFENGETVEIPRPDCVSVARRADAPFFDPRLGERPVGGYDVQFGECETGLCGWQPFVALAQYVALEPGLYRLSWYTRDGQGSLGAGAVVVRDALGNMIPAVTEDPCPGGGCTSGFICSNGVRCKGATCDGMCDEVPDEGENWNRVFLSFEVPEAQTVSIRFEPPDEGKLTLAAPMLERLEDPFFEVSSGELGPFMDTTDTRTIRLAVCEDTDGSVFRAQKWQRSCLKVCPDGYASDCRERARTECYWETSFSVDQRSIEAGQIFNQSGIAKGNFNYRIESVGLNFVGTGIRRCEDSNLPSTCHAAGFVPYTLLHDGPFFVRNDKGEDYRAHLFNGRIEHARGLATERYITNPISSPDRDLLTSYMRRELNGRPFDGAFVLRVWDEDGLDFNSIEDIQIVLNYRYWTRFH